MPTMKRFRSDRETLRLVLQFAKLSPDETSRLKAKYEDLANGRIIELSEEDRTSVHSIFDEQKVGDFQYAARLEARKAAKGSLAMSFDAMPRPKRPPGK